MCKILSPGNRLEKGEGQKFRDSVLTFFFLFLSEISTVLFRACMYDLKVLFLKNKKMATKKQALDDVELICKK